MRKTLFITFLYLFSLNVYSERYISDLEVLGITGRNIENILKKQFNVKKKGIINDNYFLMGYNIIKDDSKSKRLNLLVICDKNGEVVWYYILNKGRTNKASRYPFFHKYGDKVYVFFRHKTDGQLKESAFLEIVDLKRNKSTIQKATKLKPHHDFLIENSNLYFLKKSTKYMRQFNLEQKKYQGDIIVKYDFKNGKSEVKWDSFHTIFPTIKEINTREEKDKKEYDDKLDFTHANSIDYDSKNKKWLVSLRNTNQIIVMNKEFKTEKIFNGNKLDYYWQHHVQFHKDGFLLFNNNKEKTSYVEIRDNNMNLLKRSSLKYGDFHSPIRSSVEKIDDKYFSLFIGDHIKNPQSMIVQFNSNLEEEGRLIINHNDKSSNFYRIITLKKGDFR